MNNEIREILKEHNIPHYKLAKAIGISSWTLSVWLRDELNEERKARIDEALNKLIGGANNG